MIGFDEGMACDASSRGWQGTSYQSLRPIRANVSEKAKGVAVNWFGAAQFAPAFA